MKSDQIINQQNKIIDIGKTSSTGIFLETHQNERFILWRAKKRDSDQPKGLFISSKLICCDIYIAKSLQPKK